MRVVSWNVRSLRDDQDALIGALRALRPDVLCLQEAPRLLRSRSRLAGLARQVGLVFVCGGRAAAGPALLVSLRVDTPRTLELRFPRTSGLHQRGLAAAVVGHRGRCLAVGSVHLGLASAERVGHAGLIREQLAGLGAPEIVVAGDLNETAGGAAWQRLAEGLVDIAAVQGVAAPTFPAAAPRQRIDTILVSPGLSARAVPVAAAGLAGASDHLPVVVDVVAP